MPNSQPKSGTRALPFRAAGYVPIKHHLPMWPLWCVRNASISPWVTLICFMREDAWTHARFRHMQMKSIARVALKTVTTVRIRWTVFSAYLSTLCICRRASWHAQQITQRTPRIAYRDRSYVLRTASTARKIICVSNASPLINCSKTHATVNAPPATSPRSSTQPPANSSSRRNRPNTSPSPLSSAQFCFSSCL